MTQQAARRSPRSLVGSLFLMVLALLLASGARAQVSGVGPPKPKAETELSAREKLKRGSQPPVVEGGNGPVVSNPSTSGEILPRP
jgi:hypothetical protein